MYRTLIIMMSIYWVCNGNIKASVMKIEKYNLESSQVCIPIPENYKDCLTLIKSDRYRKTGKELSSMSVILNGLKHFNSDILFWFRLSQYKKGILWAICRLMYAHVSQRYQIQIPASTKIGYGLTLGHRTCMVINGGTIIGNNVNLSQFINIGTNHKTPAIIGDNVYIAPHVSIVEDVKINNNATIGAGSVVTRNVPENATVAGVPAKVLNYDNPARYILHRWETKEQ